MKMPPTLKLLLDPKGKCKKGTITVGMINVAVSNSSIHHFVDMKLSTRVNGIPEKKALSYLIYYT